MGSRFRSFFFGLSESNCSRTTCWKGFLPLNHFLHLFKRFVGHNLHSSIYFQFCFADLCAHIFNTKKREKILQQQLQIFSEKGSDSKYFWLCSYWQSYSTLLSGSHKQCINECVWLYSNYTLFTNIHHRLDWVQRLWFANLSSKEESNNWGKIWLPRKYFFMSYC